MAQSGGWHLEKTVSIGHIMTTLSVAVMGIGWAATVEKRVSILEISSTSHAERADQQEERHKESIGLVRSDLRGIADKLDRLIENRNK